MYDRYSVRRLAVTAAVLIIVGILKVPPSPLRQLVSGAVSFAVYLLICADWLFSIRRRFIQKALKRYMTVFSALLMFLTCVTTVKYRFVAESSFLNRQLWYWYYVPLMLLPPLMLLSTLYIGKPDRYRLPSKWHLIFIPYTAVMLGFVTNDIHQLAFRFRPDMVNWNAEYTYGVLYYAAVALLAFGVIATLAVTFQACLKQRFWHSFWLPLTVVLLGAGYWAVYVFGSTAAKALITTLFSMTEAVVLFTVCFWESLVCVHLIPSNSNHTDFFTASSLNAGLTDKNYRVRLTAPNDIVPLPEEVQQAETMPVLLGDGTTLLKSYQVRGGNFYWMEDLSEIIRLNEKLADTEDYLTEENAMLDAATAIEEGRKTFTEQNRLYDRIEKQIKPQLDKVNDLIESLPEEEELFLKQMKQAGILNAYIKRYSNLLLLAGSSPAIELSELGLALAESIEYVKLADIPAMFSSQGSGYINADFALLVYELYEALLESALPSVEAVLVSLRALDGVLTFYAEVSAPAPAFKAAPFRRRLKEAGAVLQTEQDGDTVSVTVKAYMGGEDV